MHHSKCIMTSCCPWSKKISNPCQACKSLDDLGSAFLPSSHHLSLLPDLTNLLFSNLECSKQVFTLGPLLRPLLPPRNIPLFLPSLLQLKQPKGRSSTKVFFLSNVQEVHLQPLHLCFSSPVIQAGFSWFSHYRLNSFFSVA